MASVQCSARPVHKDEMMRLDGQGSGLDKVELTLLLDKLVHDLFWHNRIEFQALNVFHAIRSMVCQSLNLITDIGERARLSWP